MTSVSTQATALTGKLIRPKLSAGWVGAALFLLIALPCFVTLPISVDQFNAQNVSDIEGDPRKPPSLYEPMGTDGLGRSLLWRCLLGGAISLGIGIAAALIAVAIGVIWGATAGFLGGHVDSVMMRIVDVLYGLPYILLVVLVDLALSPRFQSAAALIFPADVASMVADVVTLLVAIGGVSWLTMARVIRGQVLSLKAQPFVEAARACGVSSPRIIGRHLLPNLVGPIIVYTTLTVPTAILQESFLSFLGIGVQLPLPSWGNLASTGLNELYVLSLTEVSLSYVPLIGFVLLQGALITAAVVWCRRAAEPDSRRPAAATLVWLLVSLVAFKLLVLDAISLSDPTPRWWLVFFPCLLLGLTLMALNFLGDALRDYFDPKRQKT